MSNCAATKNMIAVVTLKNFCRLMRALPLTNMTPNAIAHNTPSSVPRKLINSVEFSETAERISTVSAPSRNTIKKMKMNSPNQASFPASRPTLPSISPFNLRPVFIMKTTMVTTKKAATSMIQPSKTSSFRWVREMTIATPILPRNAAASAAYTVLRNSARPIFEDVFEGWIMLVAAFFVVTMVVFKMKTGRKLKGEIEGKVGLLAGNDAWFGLFIFIFLMVLREGAETVLILSAVSLNSTELMSFLGTLLGVLCAIAFGVMFVKGSARINLQKFFKVTTAIMFLVAAQLLISGLHELSESGVIASSKREMAIIGPIVSNDWFFFVTIFAMAALMVLFEAKRRAPMLAPNASPAERRKATWTARRERLWMGSVYTFSFIFIAMVTAEFVYTMTVSALSPPSHVSFTNGKVSIPLSQ